ncbi:MAG: hypothetical protein NWF09_09635 [Candidatus Bathyarchaeota archaeon]|nr:hypothetical protein [Candidatus Bathyarchaeota archaeon]
MDKCECGCTEFIYDPETGEVICHKCGLVVRTEHFKEETISTGYTVDGENVHSAPENIMFPYKKMVTDIDPSGVDSRGVKLKNNMHRLRKIQWQTAQRETRNITKATMVINNVGERYNIPRDIRQDAMFLFRKAQNAGVLKGRSVAAVALAAVYIAQRNSGYAKTSRFIIKIAREFNVTRRTLNRCIREILDLINIKLEMPNHMQLAMKIASQTAVPPQVLNEAIKLLQKTRPMMITKNPAATAAAAIYIAALRLNINPPTQSTLAGTAAVTDVTIRHCIKTMQKAMVKAGLPLPTYKPRYAKPTVNMQRQNQAAN